MITLTYVFDAYCGWCYGFGPAIRELSAADDVEISVQHGSLFPSSRSTPLGGFPHIPVANQRISQLTGVTFGPAYRAVLEEGTLDLDSDAAARGLAALKAEAGPGRDVEVASALQRAFYIDGLSLSDPGTYATIAEAISLDPESVTAAVTSDEAAEAARAEQAHVRSLGPQHFPTLFLSVGDEQVSVGSPTSSAEELREEIERRLA